MVTEVDPVQPFASVAVIVYVPILKLLAVRLVPPLGDQLYVYGAVPPIAGLAVALPDALQLAFTCEAIVMLKVGWVMVTVANPWHPFLSVAVIVYVPSLRPVAVRFVPPLGVQL